MGAIINSNWKNSKSIKMRKKYLMMNNYKRIQLFMSYLSKKKYAESI